MSENAWYTPNGNSNEENDGNPLENVKRVFIQQKMSLTKIKTFVLPARKVVHEKQSVSPIKEADGTPTTMRINVNNKHDG